MSNAGRMWLLGTLCLLALGQHARADPCETTSRPPVITSADAYVRVLHCTFKRGRPRVRGLMARVLKGKLDEDFTTLSDDRDRKIVFLMGSDGLERLVGLTNDQILTEIGYTTEYVKRLEEAGYHFKLLVFERTAETGQLATWDHVIAMAATAYPDIAEKLKAALPRLKRTSFAKIEKQAPSTFADVDRAGRDHADFVDEQRLATSDGALWQVRAFLYYRLRVTELYAGDGVTRTADHHKGLKEYVAPNKPISDLRGGRIIDL